MKMSKRLISFVLCAIMANTFCYAAEQSLFKHITHNGAPYNIDAITGATLTVEGPGARMSVPLTVRTLQETSDAGVYRGLYGDGNGLRLYEGIRLLALLDGGINENVERLDDNVEIVFKNRWRQDIGRLTYSQIKAADAGSSPVIIAYGVAEPDGSNIRPFVYSGSAGENARLGNGDGPIKLVYNMGMAGELPKNGAFTGIAYLYVEEQGGRPGFKHTESGDTAYGNPANTEYLVTFLGDALGREITLSVSDIEKMVEYNALLGKPSPGGLGHRGEYSLSNTTYWYVNEYEGVKLWDLLLRLGLPSIEAGNGDALVSFSSWDNYAVNTQFSLKQLSDPDLFYFYEKSPLDIGVDRPTKSLLATAEYQPGNRNDGWTVDSNGYPVKKGYPVLLAYGINGYPYVRDSGLEGYKTGLGNDGGPLRLIYGKTDGLNRSDPNAIENYAYFYNNGSQQLQRVQEIYVGSEVRYSTHLENPDPAYRSMKDSAALSVEVASAGQTKTYDFSLEQLESMVYGVDKRTRDGEGRQEKGYYLHGSGGSADPQDLFEGVNLEYLLVEHIGLQGTLGKVELYGGDAELPNAVYDLAAIGEKGYNSQRGTDGLGMMVAFAKNSYPLVPDVSSPGYLQSDPSIGDMPVRNSGGPLMFVRGQTEAERNGGFISDSADDKACVENLARIRVILYPDEFAHIGPEHNEAAESRVRFSGAVAPEGGAVFTVGALETMQKYLVTGAYDVEGVAGTYRGLDLLGLLNDKAIGASGLMSEVAVSGSSGELRLSYAEMEQAAAAGKPVILAYGFSPGGPPDYSGAAPLTFPYGPMRLIMDGATAEQCISQVSEITVAAASMDGWKHDTGAYLQYQDYTLDISGQNLERNRKLAIAELESMGNKLVYDSYIIGSNEYWFQGVDLYKLLGGIGFTGDLAASEFTAVALDGYSVQFTAGQLAGGVNGKPIIVAYGQGTTRENGLPLVRDADEPGYSTASMNSGGPLRLVVNDNSGWSVKYLTAIVVGAAGGNDGETPDSGGFTAYAGGGKGGFPEAGVRSISFGPDGALWVGTYGGGLATMAPGDAAFTVYDAESDPSLQSPFTSGVAADSSGGVWFTQNTSYVDLAMNYGVGYLAPDGSIEYYGTANPGTIPDDYVQVIEIGANGDVWFGSSSGLTRYDGVKWHTWTKADGLPASSVNTIVPDNEGGVWIGCYPDTVGAVAVPQAGEVDAYAGGYAYLDADGRISFSKTYDYRESPELMPWLMADFWVRGIALDGQGGAWIVRSSSFMPHVGGRVDYVSPDKSRVISWTGKELLGSSALTGSCEIRDIAIDKNGGLWIGTSGAGLFHCVAPGIAVKAYSSATGAFPSTASMDNIYVLRYHGDRLYVGSAGGMAWAEPALGPYRPVNSFDLADRGRADEIISMLEEKGTEPVTRAEFVGALSLLAGHTGSASGAGPGFTDIDESDEHAGDIRWAASLGLVLGYPDGSFRPDKPITGEEMATLLDRFVWLGHIIPRRLLEDEAEPHDMRGVSDYAADAVIAMRKYGIIGRSPDGGFNAVEAVRGEEAAEAIRALLESAS